MSRNMGLHFSKKMASPCRANHLLIHRLGLFLINGLLHTIWKITNICGADGVSMKIETICPKCHDVLTDKFSAKSCKVAGGKYKFDMECTNCDRYYRMLIDVTLQSVVECEKAGDCLNCQGCRNIGYDYCQTCGKRLTPLST